MLYTHAGGSYVVARDNFGPRTAQIAAVRAADRLRRDRRGPVRSRHRRGRVRGPALGPYSLEITVGAVLLLAYGNLRGLKEAGRAFAFPMYFFAASIGAVIVVGVIQALTGNLDRIDPTTLDGTVDIAHGDGLVMGATVLVILRAFANGGTSLTVSKRSATASAHSRSPRASTRVGRW